MARSPDRVSRAQVARELGVSIAEARRILSRMSWVADEQGSPPTYDARVIDLWFALHGHPHRPLEPVETDWLTAYLGGTSR